MAAPWTAWAQQGVPRSPGAWLTTARGAGRSTGCAGTHAAPQTAAAGRAGRAAAERRQEPGRGEWIPDDRLRLVFTCCHPALAREAQVALTLRLVCGLSTAEIAQAFLVSEPTMAARVTRAKKKISAARIPYRVPAAGRAAGPAGRGAHRRAPAVHHRPHRARWATAWSARTWWTGRSAWPGCWARCCRTSREVPRAARAAPATDARRVTRADAGRPAAAARGAGPGAVGPARDRRGHAAGRGALRGCRPGRFALQAAIAARARRGAELRRPPTGRRSSASMTAARPCLAVPRGGPQPGRRAGHGGRAGRRAASWSPGAGAGWPATGTCRPPGRTCSGGSAGGGTRPRTYRTALELTGNGAERQPS